MHAELDIKDIRQKLGISQAEMARRLGVDQSTVCRMERGAAVRGPIRLLLRQMIDMSFPHADEHDTSVRDTSRPSAETVNEGRGL